MWGELVPLLASQLGPQRLAIAEDSVGDALLAAVESWGVDGVPANPAGWLYRVARRRAVDALRRQRTAERLAPEVAAWLDQNRDDTAPDRRALDEEVEDSQLRMIFACCHPELPKASRIALALQLLCGLSTHEIARAFLVPSATVQKRLVRAKRRLARPGVFDVPGPSALGSRIGAVLHTLYLLFNEGYSSTSAPTLVRRDLCEEAVRLAALVRPHAGAAAGTVEALLALFDFQMARFDTRIDAAGNLVRLEHQDRTRWQRDLIDRGFHHLERSAEAGRISRYHLEAGIAGSHALAPTFEATDWPAILDLYDHLCAIDPSPVARLNRAVAVAQVEGPEAGLRAIDTIGDSDALRRHPLHDAIRGELNRQAGRLRLARGLMASALAKTASPIERGHLQREVDALAAADPTATSP